MGLLLLPLFTRALSPTEYGVLALLNLVVVALSGVFSLGTANSMGLLYFREPAQKRRAVVVWTNVLLLVFNGVALVTALSIFAPTISTWIFETPDYAALLQIAFAGLAVSCIAEPFLAQLRMEENARQYVGLTLTSAFLTFALNCWFVLGLDWGIKGAALAGMAASMLSGVLVGFIIARRLPFGFDLTLLLPLVRIGFPSIFGLFAFMLIDYADRQLLQRFVGLSELGVYSVGYNLGMSMMLVVGAFGTAWPAYFMSYIGRQGEAKYVFGRVLRYYTLGVSALVLLFFAFAAPMLEILAAPEFYDANMIVGLVAAAYALKGIYLIFLPGLYFTNRLHVQAGIEWCAAIANIGLNFWWIPRLGILGAALATVVGYMLLPVLAWWFSKRCLEVDYDWRRQLWISLICIIAGFLIWRTTSDSPNSYAVIVSGVEFCIAVALTVFVGLESIERQRLAGWLRGVRASGRFRL